MDLVALHFVVLVMHRLIISDGIQKASNYRYPSPMMLVKCATQSSISLANLGSPEVRQGEESIWSPKIRNENSGAVFGGYQSLLERSKYP